MNEQQTVDIMISKFSKKFAFGLETSAMKIDRMMIY